MSRSPTPDQWTRAIAIVREIAELDLTESEAEIERRCADDPAVADAVRSLLADHEEDSEGILDPIDEQLGLTSAGLSGALPTVEGIEITGVLGRGGSGDVFAGRQLGPEREVAVKVLRSGLGSIRAVQRFNREARVLASIQHESVASIYAVAEAHLSGGAVVPCLVMEYVRGDTLRSLPKPIEPDRAAALVSELARGLHAAHQRGIVHRDMKPSNVIISEAGKPKIIDFGVAALNTGFPGTLQTITGELLGTLAYMSPEQLDGSSEIADVRSDVYALGLILFELATGAPAIDAESGSSFAAIQTITRGTLPKLPAAGDLDAIYRKATAHEPSMRYESASALADDLDRLVSGRPIVARAPSVFYTAKLFTKRNPIPVALGTAACAAVLGLTIATGVGFVSASRERDLARTAEQRAVQASTFLRDMLASPDPEIDGPNVRVVDVLGRSAGLIDGVKDSDPLVAMDLHRTIGWSYAALSLHDEAVPQLEQAVQIARDHYPPTHDDLLQLETDLGNSLVYQGRTDEALAIMRSVVDRCTNTPSVAAETAVAALAGLGEAQRSVGEYEAAERTLDRAFDRYESASDRFSTSHPQARSTLSAMGRVYLDLNKAEQAGAIFSNLIASFESEGRAGSPSWLIARGNLAIAYAGEGRHGEAVEIYEDVLSRGEPVLGENHHTMRMVRSILPDSYVQVGRDDDALAMSERALADAIAIHGRGHPDELLAVSNHSVLLMQLERWDEAVVFTQRLYDELPAALGPDHPRTLIGMRNHASALDILGRDTEAAEVLWSVLETQQSTLGDEHFDTLVTKNNLAFLLDSIGRGSEGVPLMTAVVEAAGAESGIPAPARSVFHLNLGRCLIAAGEYDRAHAELSAARELNSGSDTQAAKIDSAFDRLNAQRSAAAP